MAVCFSFISRQSRNTASEYYVYVLNRNRGVVRLHLSGLGDVSHVDQARLRYRQRQTMSVGGPGQTLFASLPHIRMFN